MEKYCRVMFGTTSSANKDLNFKLDEINVAEVWDPLKKDPKEMGGFNFSVPEKIIRWIHRGDTIYDVILPSTAEVVDVIGSATPHGIFRSNEIILTNPRKVTDEMAMEFYKISTIPEFAYYKAIGAVSIMGYDKCAKQMLRDKVNDDNIGVVLDEWNNFTDRSDRINVNKTVKDINEALLEIKNDLLITWHIDREPYIKKLTNDKIINVTGESGSGKSTYVKKYLNDSNYIVIDTDQLKENQLPTNKNTLKIKDYLDNKYGKNKLDLCNDFKIIYQEILDYYKDSDKILVIDSAQYRNLKTLEELNLLKGKMIILRTCIDTCYKRCVERWQANNKNYTLEELNNYKNKKYKIYEWYKSLNEFVQNIDKL